MAEMNDIVQVAVDAYHGNVTKYSVGDSMELLRKAMIEANGGSTVMNYKNIRDGKCNGLFTLIEEILSRTIVDGLQGDEFFNSLVDFRNVGMGDKNLFLVEDSDLFVVSQAADGTQGIRRQRLGGYNEVTIPTTFRVVKIYEEMNRILSGQVDFNKFITKVGESFRQQMLNDIYSMWASASTEDLGGTVYAVAGAYDEDTLLELVDHVEAAAGGKPATIVGTKAALRNLIPAIVPVAGSDPSVNDLYNLGYTGKFYGTNVVALPQRHQINSTEFVYDNKSLAVIAGDDKPIKVVTEGDSVVLMNDPTSNRDFTQDYFYGEKYGVGMVLAGGNAGIGRYDMT